MLRDLWNYEKLSRLCVLGFIRQLVIRRITPTPPLSSTAISAVPHNPAEHDLRVFARKVSPAVITVWFWWSMYEVYTDLSS